MPKSTRSTSVDEQTAHFVIYDAKTGRILAVHHVTALAGMRVPTEALVQKRVLACAAEALDRNAADLRLLATAEAKTVSPGVRVDVATAKLVAPAPRRGVQERAKSGGTKSVETAARLLSP